MTIDKLPTFHHLSIENPYFIELKDSVGMEFMVEMIEITLEDIPNDVTKIQQIIDDNEFLDLSRALHTTCSRLRPFFDFDSPVIQDIRKFEDLAKVKAREHQTQNFVKDDQDFHTLFLNIKDRLIEPMNELKVLLAFYKSKITS